MVFRSEVFQGRAEYPGPLRVPGTGSRARAEAAAGVR